MTRQGAPSQHSTLTAGYTVQEDHGGIIRLQFTRGSADYGDSTTVAENILQDVQQLMADYGSGEALFLVQLVDDDGVVSSEANKIYKQMMTDERIMKMAIFGGLQKYRLLAKALLPLTMGNTIRVFKTKQQALKWLMTS